MVRLGRYLVFGICLQSMGCTMETHVLGYVTDETPINPLDDEDVNHPADHAEDDEGLDNLDIDFDPNWLDQDALFQCDGQPSSSPGRIRRIDSHEFAHTLGKSQTGFRGSIAGTNPFTQAASHLYSTYSEGQTIDEITLGIHLDVPAQERHPWNVSNQRGLAGDS